MKNTNNWTEKVKRSIRKGWDTFVDAVYADQKKTMIYCIGGLVVVCLGTFLVMKTNTSIRAQQINNITYNDFTTGKVKPLDYKTEDETIKKKNAISVMFSKPHGKDYQAIKTLVTEKDSELNRSFYYYPIVYNTDNIAQKYDIDPNKITFIFFEEGKEKNRFTYEEMSAPEISFIPEMNRLPMWNINKKSANSEN